MSTTEINDIVKYLTKNGLTPEDIEDDGDFTCLDYDSFWVDIDCTDDKINAEFHVALAYKFTFIQGLLIFSKLICNRLGNIQGVSKSCI